MRPTKTVELLVGLFVAAGVLALFFLAMRASNLAEFGGGEGYRLIARFENSGSLKIRSPVTIAGVRVGRVRSIAIDHETFQSVVEMVINHSTITLPADTSASIYTEGLLGEQFVSLDPGGEEEYLKDGDEIELTQSAIVLEEIIGQFLFSKAEETPDD